MNDMRRIIEQIVIATRGAEDAAQEALAAYRESEQSNREWIESLVGAVGWWPRMYEVILAQGKAVAGAEAAFAGAVEQREATERLRDELGSSR